MLASLNTQKIIFVGGKGGVGKTTTAASIACYFAKQQQKVLVISTDPAHSLGDAFDTPLSGEIQALTPYLSALEFDLEAITQRHFESLSKKIAKFTKPEMRPRMAQQLALAKDAPGGQEAALLEAMCGYLINFESLGFDKLIFDTAPSGHTLRLLNLPEMMSAWTEGLIAQQKKQQQHKEAAEPFWKRANSTGAHNPFRAAEQEPWQQALNSLEARKALFKQARDRIHDTNQTAIVLVMIPEKLPLEETCRNLDQFQRMALDCHSVLINQVIDKSLCENEFWQQRYALQQDILTQVSEKIKSPSYLCPLQAQNIVGIDLLQNFLTNSTGLN